MSDPSRERPSAPRPAGAPRLVRDERGLVSGCLVRAIVFFLLLALALEEGGQLLLGVTRAHSAASAAARAGADTYYATHSHVRTEGAAGHAAKVVDPRAKVQRLTIGREGDVTVTVRVEARTVIISRVSFLRDIGIVHGTEQDIHST